MVMQSAKRTKKELRAQFLFCVRFAAKLQSVACGRVIERERGSKTAPFTLSLPG